MARILIEGFLLQQRQNLLSTLLILAPTISFFNCSKHCCVDLFLSPPNVRYVLPGIIPIQGLMNIKGEFCDDLGLFQARQ